MAKSGNDSDDDDQPLAIGPRPCPTARCGGMLQWANSIFKWPMKFILKYIFSIRELAEAINNSTESREIGPLSTPRAKEKMAKLGSFATDIRTIYITLCADAGNPTKKWSQISLLPFFLVFENLPEVMRNRMENIMMFCLVPGPKHAKHLLPYLSEFVNEMNVILRNGLECWDEYKQQWFTLRAVVLRVIGDYPGLSQMLDLADHKSKAGCIKCTGLAESHFSTMCHEMNVGMSKTHEWFTGMFVQLAQRKEGDNKEALEDLIKKTGINGITVLAQLSHFDMSKDTMLDFIHLVKRVFHHLTRLVKGRKAKVKTMEAREQKNDLLQAAIFARANEPGPDSESESISDEARRGGAAAASAGRTELNKMKSWSISKNKQAEADAALSFILAPTNYYCNGKMPLVRGGQMKMNDVQHWFTNYGAFHIWSMDLEPTHAAMLYDLQLLLKCMFEWEFDPDDSKSNEKELDDLDKRIQTVLQRWQDMTPMTARATVFHLLLHFPAQMRNWGSIRWCWMYPYERFIGAIFNFIHGRQAMATELVNKYSRKLQSRKLLDKTFARISLTRGDTDACWNRLLKSREQANSRYAESNYARRLAMPTLRDGQLTHPRGAKVKSEGIPPLTAFFTKYPVFKSTNRHQVWRIGGHALSLRGRRMGTFDQNPNNSCLRMCRPDDADCYIQAYDWYHLRLFDEAGANCLDKVFCEYHLLDEGNRESVTDWPRILNFAFDKRGGRTDIKEWCEASAINAIAVLATDFKSRNGHFVIDHI